MRKTSDPIGKELFQMLKGAYHLWDVGALKNADYDAIAHVVVERAYALRDAKKIGRYYFNRIDDEQSANVYAVHDIPDFSDTTETTESTRR